MPLTARANSVHERPAEVQYSVQTRLHRDEYARCVCGFLVG